LYTGSSIDFVFMNSTAKWVFSLGLLLLVGVSLASAQATKGIARIKEPPRKSMRKIALIIGNANYDSAPLRNPANDARSMSQVLQKLGFDVDLLEDASQREMKRGIDRFGKKLQDGGLGLFYYSGHGMQVGGLNYMIPVQAQIGAEEDVEYEAVDVGRVLAKMEAARNGMNLVILDACRNNPYARSFRSAAQGLATLSAPSGTFIAYATAPGSVASDGSGANGLYTGELIEHMQTPGLKLEEVFKRVRTSVQEKSNGAQVPWDASSMTGDFFFVKAQPEQPKAIARLESSSEALNKALAPSQYRADEEAWELVKDSDNTEDLEFFVKSFPSSKLRKVAELKLKMLERHQGKQAKALRPVEVSVPHEVRPVANVSSGETSLEQEMRKEFKEIQLGSTQERKDAFVQKYGNFSWAYSEVQQVKSDLTTHNSKPSGEESSRFNEPQMINEYKELNFYRPNKQKYKKFIIRYEEFPEAKKQVDFVRERLLALEKKNPPSPSHVDGISSLEQEMHKEFQEIQSKPDWLVKTKELQESFIEKYSRFSWAHEEVQKFKSLLTKNQQSEPQKIDFVTNKRLQALYKSAEKESRETIGCGLFGFGCPSPLVFPEYQRGFHIKHYRRVKVNGNRSSWTDTGIKLDFSDIVVMVASGEVKICNGCSKSGMLSLLNDSWLLVFRVGTEQRPREPWWAHKESIHTARISIKEMGNLEMVVRDGSYPFPSEYYKDNGGSFLVDVFVFEEKYEEEFKTFRDALIQSNPEDEHVKAGLHVKGYMGR
jgi:hypothetical protein